MFNETKINNILVFITFLIDIIYNIKYLKVRNMNILKCLLCLFYNKLKEMDI